MTHRYEQSIDNEDQYTDTVFDHPLPTVDYIEGIPGIIEWQRWGDVPQPIPAPGMVRACISHHRESVYPRGQIPLMQPDASGDSGLIARTKHAKQLR
jgi:hypothetical protein